jgi:hypothetical protein
LKGWRGYRVTLISLLIATPLRPKYHALYQPFNILLFKGTTQFLIYQKILKVFCAERLPASGSSAPIHQPASNRQTSDKKPTNKFHIITICKYVSYQANEMLSDKQVTNNRQTSDKQSTTPTDSTDRYNII